MPERMPETRHPNATSVEARVARVVDRARARLERMVQTSPDLGRFSPPSNVGNASRVLSGVVPFLRDNPQLIEQLAEASKIDGTGKTTMLIVPHLPLVLADTGSSITVFAPVLSCTLNAVDQAFEGMPRSRDIYDVVTSDGGLEDAVWQHSIRRPGDTFDFDGRTMNPADYIALAVKAFENETFRMRFAKGDTIFTPLD